MFKVFQPGTLAAGEYWGKCHQCQCMMVKLWEDLDRPGPDLCGQDCYDDYWEEDSRKLPGWAVDDW
jgi:hypothetical protein